MATGQDPVQAGDPQQPVQARGDINEDETAPGATGSVVGADEDAEPGGVMHLRAGQVHHQVALPPVHDVMQEQADVRDRVDVQASGHDDLRARHGLQHAHR